MPKKKKLIKGTIKTNISFKQLYIYICKNACIRCSRLFMFCQGLFQ